MANAITTQLLLLKIIFIFFLMTVPGFAVALGSLHFKRHPFALSSSTFGPVVAVLSALGGLCIGVAYCLPILIRKTGWPQVSADSNFVWGPVALVIRNPWLK